MTEDKGKPDIFERGPGARMVMAELELVGKDNESMLISCKVTRMTAESKAKAGEYQNDVRGYVEVEPENLWVHVPVMNPAQLVDEGGDVDVALYVWRQVARTLDMSVVQLAMERADRAMIKVDMERAIAERRAEVKPVRKEVTGTAEAL